MHLKLVVNPPETTPATPVPTARKGRPRRARPAPTTSKGVIPSRTIGHETIYAQQERLAEATIRYLLANQNSRTLNKRTPIIVLQPQGGKTGVVEALCDKFIDYCVAGDLTFQIIFLCGLSHLGLTEQTRSRLTANWSGATRIGADLGLKAMATRLTRYPGRLQGEIGIFITHNSPKLRREVLNMPGVDVRLVIGDEVHLGNVKDGNIDRFLQTHGMKICEQIHSWEKGGTVNHFVGVSATPSAHIIASDCMDLDGPALFHVIYEPPPDNYNSLGKMRANVRLKDTEALFIGDKNSIKPSVFFQNVLNDFRKACKTQGPGYLVIRATGKKHDQLTRYIKREGATIECLPFDTLTKNLDELNAQLSRKPLEPTFVIIRGGMRAGITLGLTNYIRGWVETESGASDAPTQSGAGRACGFGRTKDTYPIYAHLKRIDAWIKSYAEMDREYLTSVPSGVQNKGSKECTRYEFWKMMSYQSAYKKWVKPYNDKYNEGQRLRTPGAARFRRQISATSLNVLNDVAGLFMDGRHDSLATVGILVDGPLTDEAIHKFIELHPGYPIEKVTEKARQARASYKLLIEKYPGSYGKALLYKLDPVTGLPVGRRMAGLGQSRDELQKPTSATRNAPKK